MPRQALIATALPVGISMLAVAAVVKFYSEDVRHHCLGPNCVVGYTRRPGQGYDYSARKAVSHTGAADIKSGGGCSYRMYAQGHPSAVGCIGDHWSCCRWMRLDYDTPDWYAVGLYATRRRTLSSL